MLNSLRACLINVAMLALAFGSSSIAQTQPSDPWPGLVKDLFQDQPLIVGDGVVTLEAPSRAEDAAIVPVAIRFNDPSEVKSATLVIDENPMPMAAAFTLGQKAHVSSIETRVRVNSYTHVHAVAQSLDDRLHVDAKFVKAAGGCSAPAIKDQDQAKAHLGQMKYRAFKTADPNLLEAQIMIRHPNNSGMQMDQLTRLYIPAHYIDKVEVRQGDDTIFVMEGGISLSEDPNFRFSYARTGAKTISVIAHDNKGATFKGEWPIGDGS
jgi:sulfur-oxidizing protein SoxY